MELFLFLFVFAKETQRQLEHSAGMCLLIACIHLKTTPQPNLYVRISQSFKIVWYWELYMRASLLTARRPFLRHLLLTCSLRREADCGAELLAVAVTAMSGVRVAFIGCLHTISRTLLAFSCLCT